MNKRCLSITLVFVLTITLISSISALEQVRVEISDYNINMINELSVPINLTLEYNRYSSWLGTNNNVILNRIVNNNSIETYQDPFSTTFGCGTMFACSISLISFNYTEEGNQTPIEENLSKIEYLENKITNLTIRVNELELSNQNFENRIIVLENRNMTCPCPDNSNISQSITNLEQRTSALEGLINRVISFIKNLPQGLSKGFS